MLGIETAPLEALGRLRAIAEENGGSDPDLWNVDAAVYPGDLGFEPEINAMCQLWRGGPKP